MTQGVLVDAVQLAPRVLVDHNGGKRRIVAAGDQRRMVAVMPPAFICAVGRRRQRRAQENRTGQSQSEAHAGPNRGKPTFAGTRHYAPLTTQQRDVARWRTRPVARTPHSQRLCRCGYGDVNAAPRRSVAVLQGAEMTRISIGSGFPRVGGFQTIRPIALILLAQQSGSPPEPSATGALRVGATWRRQCAQFLASGRGGLRRSSLAAKRGIRHSFRVREAVAPTCRVLQSRPRMPQILI